MGNVDAAIADITQTVIDNAAIYVNETAHNLCTWINSEVQKTKENPNFAPWISGTDKRMIYDPQHAEQRESHLAPVIADVFEAVVETGSDPLVSHVVIKTKDNLEITDEMEKTLNISISNAKRLVGGFLS